MIKNKSKLLLVVICILIMVLAGCKDSGASIKTEYKNSADGSSSLTLSSTDSSLLDTIARSLAVIPKQTDDNSIGDTSVMSANASLLVRLSDEEISSDQVIYEKNVYQTIPPASLTKLMTALLTLERADMSSTVIINDQAKVSIKDAQVTGLSSGDNISVADLMKSMLIWSGNDSANALGVYVGGGSLDEFYNMMNAKAESLCATHTHFVSANGLDNDNHYSCVYDLYLIFRECIKYDTFLDIIAMPEAGINYTKSDGEAVAKNLKSTNLYFHGEYAPPAGVNVLGGKTGTTDNAGNCLIIYLSDSAGHKYIAISMGNEKKEILYNEMNNLLSLIN